MSLSASRFLGGSSLRLRCRFQSSLAAIVLTLASAGCIAQTAASSDAEFIWAPDFPIGAKIPDLTSLDQNAEEQTFNSLKGERGLLFLLSRSFDW